VKQSWKIRTELEKFSEMGFEFGWRNLQGSGIVKFLLYSPEGLKFSATFGEAEKSKVAKGQNIKNEVPSNKKIKGKRFTNR